MTFAVTEKGERTMTCKDCINYSSCLGRGDVAPKELMEGAEDDCDLFKNKADYAEVKHGHWIVPSGEIKIFENRYVICSECNVMIPLVKELNGYCFCPNCGAKMDAK